MLRKGFLFDVLPHISPYIYISPSKVHLYFSIIYLYIYIYIYIYNGEIKMYFYLAMVGFKHTLTATAAPSNTETTVIPSRPLRSLKKE